MITVLCATKGDRQPGGLEHVPGGANLQINTSKPWAAAANALLDSQMGLVQDGVLFLDDDIELTPASFQCFEQYKSKADIIGFSLFNPVDGGLALQSAGFQMLQAADNGAAMLFPIHDLFDLLQPRYVAHVTASCMWISQKVIESGLRFPVWSGQHHEDVAFTYEAWMRGFKVMHVPGPVIHHTTAGVGATKSQDPNFQGDRMVNWACLEKWQVDNDVQGAIARGVIPLGARPVE